jgi:hypothetical protein
MFGMTWYFGTLREGIEMQKTTSIGFGLVLGVLGAAGAALGQAALSFTAPAVAQQPNVVVQPGNVTVIQDPLTLVNSNAWTNINGTNLFADLTNDQGFTNEYGWFFDSITLGNTANFNVTVNQDTVNPFQAGGQVKASVQLSVNFGNTVQPADSTVHWLQILDEDQQYGTTETGGTAFGYSIPPLPGYWEFDNGDVQNNGNGIAPFYDSNDGPNIVPPDFSDNASVGSAIPGTFLHFILIPTWDVTSGNTNTVYVASQGIAWGYAVVPEPASVGLLALIVTGGLMRRRRG